MKNNSPNDFFKKLEDLGEEQVRLRLALGAFAPQRKIDLVNYWLKQKEIKSGNQSTSQSENTNINKLDAWQNIKIDYGVTKRGLGKNLNFVKDKYIKKIIFRDIEQAYLLANTGYYKPSVILAGSVIEELLRIYLNSNNVIITNGTFNQYIKACQQNNLLQTAIHGLSDSVRNFRNYVHLEKENTPKLTIKKSTAIGAVSAIFTIANDF